MENEDGSGPRLSRTGLWLRYVQPVQRDDRECWTETYSAVDVPQTMALTWMLIQLLGTLWSVGRVRVGLDQELRMALPSGDQMRHLLDEPRMDIRRVRIDLPYQARDLIITIEVDVVSAHPLGPPAEADVE